MNETLESGIALASIPLIRRILLATAATNADVGKIVSAVERVGTKDAHARLERIAEDIERGGYSGSVRCPWT